jgi:prevent-host-death family protein
MTLEVPVTQAREQLAELVNRVAYGHERVILTRHSKPVACIVPPEDMAWLEQRGQERINLTSTGPGTATLHLAGAADPLPAAAQHRLGEQQQGGAPPAHHDSPDRDRQRPTPDIQS